MYYVHESNSCTNNDFYETMKYSFQKVPSLTNSPLLTTGQSTWVNQKEENLSFTGAYSAVFILFNTFAIKTTKKKDEHRWSFIQGCFKTKALAQASVIKPCPCTGDICSPNSLRRTSRVSVGFKRIFSALKNCE